MECLLEIFNFLEEISSLSHSIVFLYFFALFAYNIRCPNGPSHMLISAILSYILQWYAHVTRLGSTVLADFD